MNTPAADNRHNSSVVHGNKVVILFTPGHRFLGLLCSHGARGIQELDFVMKSSAEGARIEALQPPRV